MKETILPYKEEVPIIGHVIEFLREDNLEKIVEGFKDSSNPYLEAFSEFGERIRNEGYERLSDYSVELASELLEEVYLGNVASQVSGDIMGLINSLCNFSYNVSEDNEIKNKSLRNIVFVGIYSNNYTLANSALNEFKKSGDSLEAELIGSYINYSKDKFSNADGFISVVSKWIDHSDNALGKLWRAKAYASKGDYEKAKEDLDAVSKTELSESGLYYVLKARIESKIAFDGEEFKKAYERYLETISSTIKNLFPPNPQNKRQNPERGMYA